MYYASKISSWKFNLILEIWDLAMDVSVNVCYIFEMRWDINVDVGNCSYSTEICQQQQTVWRFTVTLPNKRTVHIWYAKMGNQKNGKLKIVDRINEFVCILESKW